MSSSVINNSLVALDKAVGVASGFLSSEARDWAHHLTLGILICKMREMKVPTLWNYCED